MILNGRFIGGIQDKSIGYAGVAETFAQPDFASRVMLVYNVPQGLKTGDNVSIAWPEGRIIGFKVNPDFKKKRPGFWQRLSNFLDQTVEY